MSKRFNDLSQVTDFLQTVSPFDSLDAETLRKIARKLEASYHPAGKVIFSSRPAPGLAILRKGAVRLLDQQHKFLDRRSEGELFGHEIRFHGAVKDYVAEAEEDCLLWQMEREQFARLCAANPTIAGYFDSQVKSRLQAATRAQQEVTQLRDLLQRPAVQVDSRVTIRQAAQVMSAENVSSVLVMTGPELSGIVTDKDLRQRVLAPGLDPGQPIATVMTPMPMNLGADAAVDEALLLMMRANCHHLPVVEDGKPVGLVTAGDILRVQSEHPLRIVRDIYKAGSIDALLALSQRWPPLFQRMVQLGREVEQTGRMVTLITDAFTLRLIAMAEKALGSPPMKYAWVAFGSQARAEQTAITDQDNGLVLERQATAEEAEYFAKLSQNVCGGLDRLGYDFCPGEVMALNPQWRVPLSAWKQHFDHWIDEPDPKSVMLCSIFFDIRCVHGDSTLVDSLQEHASTRARDNQIFRRFLAANAISHRPPLGFFRQFVQEIDGSHSEGLNLKHRGIVPITDLVRLRALEAGLREPNTFRRIELATAADVMNEEDASSLRDALKLISGIRLNHQSAQMSRGSQASNLVPPEELSPLMRRNLKAAFMLVAEAQNALELRYQLH